MKNTIIALLLATFSIISYGQCVDSDPVWTHCANQYGLGTPNNCSFTGLREMRFGNGVEWSYKNEFGGMQASMCRANQFPDVAFSGGPYRCEYSSVLEYSPIDTPENCVNRHDCNGFDNIPAGATGKTTRNISEGNTPPTAGAGHGAFRTKCDVSHFAFDDPLVYPNQRGASHLHMFFGNDSINSTSDTTNLANTGGSTCDGGTLNRSAYWTPALLDMSAKKPVLPEDSIWYYKEGYNGLSGSDFVLPEGLGMIGREFYWTCNGGATRYQNIPSCASGERLDLIVDFPQCWDGQNKWLSDESHTAYPSDRKCPDSHPKVLPQITLNLRYRVLYEGQTNNLMLSSDMGGVAKGSTAHADWINGWNPEISEKWLVNCLESQGDCNANLLGEGEMLY